MDISTLIFLVFGFAMLVVAFVFEGGSPGALLGATPAMIVFGGTIGAVGVSFTSGELKKIGKIIGVMLKGDKTNLPELIAFFKQIAFKTRKEGLLSIEEMISGEEIDPFVKKGLQMVVDGIEPQTVKSTLELSVELIAERHEAGIGIFEAAGGYAPTMGIIGTVMGLVHVLGDLSDTASLGGKIATAFIATLYGVASANLLWLPISTKLKRLDAAEAKEKSLIIEAILCIQEGVNPNTLDEKLKGFLDKKQLAQYEAINGSEEA
ncbi:MAG: motility protein A [Bacillota bacterium]|nr:motility protein A [Bacillota bacterium]